MEGLWAVLWGKEPCHDDDPHEDGPPEDETGKPTGAPDEPQLGRVWHTVAKKRRITKGQKGGPAVLASDEVFNEFTMTNETGVMIERMTKVFCPHCMTFCFIKEEPLIHVCEECAGISVPKQYGKKWYLKKPELELIEYLREIGTWDDYVQLSAEIRARSKASRTVRP